MMSLGFGVGLNRGRAKLAYVPPAPDLVAFVGHSLVSPSIAPMFAQLSGDDVAWQVINGAPLIVNWNEHADAQGESVRDLLGSQSVSGLVLAEGGPIEGSISGGSTREYLKTWRAAGLGQNPAMKTLWYQIWPEIVGWDTAPDWPLWISEIERLAGEAYGVVSQQVAFDLAPDRIYLSPVGEVFAAVYAAFQAGDLTGVTDFKDTFFPIDGIHLPPVGFYVATLTHHAVLKGVSPVGLPWGLSPAVTGLTADLAAELQAIVWDVVSNHPYAGIAPWPEPAAGALTIDQPTFYGISSGGAGTVGGSLDVGAAGAGRVGFVAILSQVTPNVASVGIDVGGPNQSMFAKVAEITGGNVYELWAGSLDAGLSGAETLTVTVSSGDRWATGVTATVVHGGADLASAVYYTSPGAGIQGVMGAAGDALFAVASTTNGSPHMIVLTPEVEGILVDNNNIDGWPSPNAYGVLATSMNSEIALANNAPKLAVVISPL